MCWNLAGSSQQMDRLKLAIPGGSMPKLRKGDFSKCASCAEMKLVSCRNAATPSRQCADLLLMDSSDTLGNSLRSSRT